MSSDKAKVYANDDYGFVGWLGASIPLYSGDEYDLDDPMVQAHPEWFTGAAPEGVEPEPAPKKRGGRRA